MPQDNLQNQLHNYKYSQESRNKQDFGERILISCDFAIRPQCCDSTPVIGRFLAWHDMMKLAKSPCAHILKIKDRGVQCITNHGVIATFEDRGGVRISIGQVCIL